MNKDEGLPIEELALDAEMTTGGMPRRENPVTGKQEVFYTEVGNPKGQWVSPDIAIHLAFTSSAGSYIQAAFQPPQRRWWEFWK